MIKAQFQGRKASSFLLIALTLWLTFAANLAYAKPKVKVEYNKVKDQTEVSIPRELITKRFSYDAGYVYEGKTPSRPNQVGLRFFGIRPLTLGDRVQWNRVDRVYFRYGDTKANYPVIYDNGQSNDTLVKGLFGTVVVETLVCFIPTDEFVAMSQTDELLLQIADKTSTLKGGNIELLTALGKMIPPKPKDTEPQPDNGAVE